MIRLFTPLALFLTCAVAAAQAPPVPPPAAPPATPPGEAKARELFLAGKLDDALRELQEAAKANPKLPPPRVTLAAMFLANRQGPNARQSLEAAAAEDPKHPDVYLLNAQFALNEGRLTEGVLNCQAALTLAADPRWDADQRKRFARDARLGLAAAFEGRRDWAMAREQLAAVLADEPKNGVARVRLGACLFFLDKPDEAFAEFTRAVADDPAVELPELQMAGLFAAKNAPDKAEDWLKKAVAARPADAKPARTYAGWLMEQGRLPDAQAQLDAAGRVDPANKDLTSLRAVAHRYKKEYAQAEPLFEGLLRDSPANRFAAWNLALVLAESGDKDKLRRGTELAESEARKPPNAGEGYAVLGWCYYKGGRLDEAERCLATAAQLGPLTRDAGYFYARILTDKQRLDDAAKILRASAQLRGPYVYQADGQALLADVEKRLPPPTPEKK